MGLNEKTAGRSIKAKERLEADGVVGPGAVAKGGGGGGRPGHPPHRELERTFNFSRGPTSASVLKEEKTLVTAHTP